MRLNNGLKVKLLITNMRNQVSSFKMAQNILSQVSKWRAEVVMVD